MAIIEYKNVSLNYGKKTALEDISLTIGENKIVGLLGRNGAGKTSMLALLASLRKPTSGGVTVDGEVAFENAEVMEKCFMVWANQTIYDEGTIVDQLQYCNDFRLEFDYEYAKKLVSMFGLELSQKVKSLSQGMRATVNVICAMASRSEITIFDEAYLGMDAPNRKLFYKELLNDYMDNPRTIILSTHYIEEVESLFEDVIMLDEGKVLFNESVDDIKSKAVTIVGPNHEILPLENKYNVISSQTLGKTKSIVIYDELSDGQLQNFAKAGLDIEKPSLQDIFIYLTEKGGRYHA